MVKFTGSVSKSNFDKFVSSIRNYIQVEDHHFLKQEAITRNVRGVASDLSTNVERLSDSLQQSLDTSQTQLRNDFQHLKFSMDTLSTILEKRYTDMMNLDTIHRKIRSATADFHVLADSLKRDIKLHQDELHKAVDRIAASVIASCEEADEHISDAFHYHSGNLEAAPCGTKLCGTGWSHQSSLTKVTNPLPEATEADKKIRSLLDIYGLRSQHPTSLSELENKETKTI